MRRAYRPRPSTRELVRRIEALDGVFSAGIIAPHHGVVVEPAQIIVNLESFDQEGKRVYTIFSLKQARQWVELEEAQS
jgi:hypothetical protein